MGRTPIGSGGAGEITMRVSATAEQIGAMNKNPMPMRASVNGPRRRRMIRGTIVRIGELAMRYGLPSQLATLDCTSSRRSTVMCALPQETAVTTVYQRDSSSKRPRSSVVFTARALARASPCGCQKMSTASRASRPAGGACGAPGPRAPLLTGRLLCRLPARVTSPSQEGGLTKGHSISD